MVVTKLSSQKRDSSRVNLYIDKNFFCGLSLDLIAKYNIYLGKELSDTELDIILKDELENRLLQRAMTYISRAIKTEFQVRRYLRDLIFKKKGIWFNDMEKEQSEQLTEKVILKLKEYKYIDDEEFAEQFILSRVKNKPRGKIVISSELQSKGVNKEIAISKVEELIEDEYDILKRVYKKKYNEERFSTDDRRKIDFLRRKGFSWDLIQKYIENEFAN